MRIAPEIAALWHNLGLALKRLDRLSEARMVWAESMRLRRGCPADPSAILDADERRALRRANGPKLAHDLAQLRWLRAERVAGPEVEPAIAALAALAARMPETDSRLRELTETGLGAAAGIFNRLAFLADGRAVDLLARDVVKRLLAKPREVVIRLLRLLCLVQGSNDCLALAAIHEDLHCFLKRRCRSFGHARESHAFHA